MKKLFKALAAFAKLAWAKVYAWLDKLRISTITQRVCDKKLIAAANKTALYGMARKDTLYMKPLQIGVIAGSSPFECLTEIPTVTVGGESTYIMSAPGYGRVFPWPDSFVRYLADTRAADIEKQFDGLIVHLIAEQTTAAQRVLFKRHLTVEAIKKAVIRIIEVTCAEPFGETVIPDGSEYFRDSDGRHLILVTSYKRIEDSEKRLLCDEPAWEDEMHYQNYIDRDLYPGEYGRLKLGERFYVVVLQTLDDRMMRAMLFGRDALTVTPVENNLHAIFRRTPVGEIGRQPRGIDVGYEMQFGVAADFDRCVILEAEKAVEKV